LYGSKCKVVTSHCPISICKQYHKIENACFDCTLTCTPKVLDFSQVNQKVQVPVLRGFGVRDSVVARLKDTHALAIAVTSSDHVGWYQETCQGRRLLRSKEEKDFDSRHDVLVATGIRAAPLANDIVVAIPKWIAAGRRPGTVHLTALRERTGYPHTSGSKAPSGVAATLLR
jgi:hypothetical protein